MYTSTSDPISDMLTRIRNAIGASKNNISLPHSHVKEAVARLLVENNFIDGLEVVDSVPKMLTININADHTSARITEISKLSKPGRRAYVNAKEIPVVKQGRGMIIISTSKGVMTGDQAKTEHIGGELICQVY